MGWLTLPVRRALNEGDVEGATGGARRPALAWAAEHAIPPLTSRKQAGLGVRTLRPAIRGGGQPVSTTRPHGATCARAGIPAAATSGVGETVSWTSVSSTIPSATSNEVNNSTTAKMMITAPQSCLARRPTTEGGTRHFAFGRRASEGPGPWASSCSAASTASGPGTGLCVAAGGGAADEGAPGAADETERHQSREPPGGRVPPRHEAVAAGRLARIIKA